MSLAVDGGTPVRTAPFPPRVQMTADELQAAVDILRRSQSGPCALDRYGGEHVDAYEQEFAEHVGVQYATAVSSGTAAVHAALGALHLDVGGEVITPPITDPGAVAPILWCNCIPVFADVDPETMNLDPASVAERITDKTVALIATHLTGQPCDMDPLLALAERRGLPVIEDCAQAHDAVYRGRTVGSLGTLGAFSLMSGKHSTSGGQGGMVTTNDRALYLDAKRFADRGKPFESDAGGNLFLGNNYRMTELSAAIGRAQLRRLPRIVGRRRELVARLGEKLRGLRGVRLGKRLDGVEHSYWFVLVRVDTDRLRVDKARFVAAVQAEGIPLGLAYDHIVYEQPWIRDRQTYGRSQCPWRCPFYGRDIDYTNCCPNARKAIDNHAMLTIHESMTDGDIDDVAEALAKVEGAYRV